MPPEIRNKMMVCNIYFDIFKENTAVLLILVVNSSYYNRFILHV